jgi:hypothetical protein
LNSSFLSSKRRLWDLPVLIVLVLVITLLIDGSAAALFAVGFVWNWVANQDIDPLFMNRRSKFSMLRMVINLQNMILKPFTTAPELVKIMLKCLPAGLFWFGVIYLNDSKMPCYMTFVGSLTFELSNLVKKPKAALP